MFRNTYQAGFLSILYSIGSKPLQIWDKKGTLPLRLRGVREAQSRLLVAGCSLSRIARRSVEDAVACCSVKAA